MKKPSQPPVRVGLISLGCAKNLVDAEIMLGSLLTEGVEITNDPAQADALIVNTCSFIDAAQEESIETILESSEIRKAHRPGQALIVSGCLPQRFPKELPKLLPEVDAFMGVDQVARVGQIVREAIARRERVSQPATTAKSRPAANEPKPKANPKPAAGGKASASVRLLQAGEERATAAPTAPAPAPAAGGPLLAVNLRPNYIPDFGTPRFRLTPKHFAYVKIAEGCNHPCSFCIIPRMRGSHRSRPQGDIVSEARRLLAEGVKELNLISQDSTYYGLDLRPDHRRNIASPEQFGAATRALPADATTLSTLLRALNELPGDFWIRLLYTHPAHWTDELIRTIAACPKVARYVDMPLQHIHENMLQRMRRETSQQYIIELIQRIRRGVPGIALRTTFIVGFPGETEASFETLLEFIRETRFERLGIFTYSQEDGTRAASMAGQLTNAVKQKRRARAMAEQHRIARALSGACVGRTMRVLTEHEATARELKSARVRSWEHGLIREADGGAGRLRGRFVVARGEADAPDIDGRIYVRGELPPGEFSQVRIIGHTDYDLLGEPA